MNLINLFETTSVLAEVGENKLANQRQLSDRATMQHRPIDDPTPNGAPMQVEGLTRLSDLMRHKVSQEQMLAGRVLRRAENPLT
jgi:hypothetical protein